MSLKQAGKAKVSCPDCRRIALVSISAEGIFGPEISGWVVDENDGVLYCPDCAGDKNCGNRGHA